MKKLLLLTIMLPSICWGQGKPAGPKPLTAEEKNQISRAEVVMLKAQSQKIADQERDDKLIQQAQKDLQAQINSIYEAREIKTDDWTLCETRAEPYCTAAPVNDLSLQPVPKPKETK